MLTLAAVAILTVIACLFTRATDQNAFRAEIKEYIAMTAQDTVDAITAQLGKAKSEISGEVASLKAQVAAAGAGEQVDFGPLEAIAQSLDDIVPDVVVEPAEDPAPVEPVEDVPASDAAE